MKPEEGNTGMPIANWQLKCLVLNEIENWTPKYEFSFQFWGEGNNNVFIDKDDVEIHSTGGYETPLDAMIAALEYIYKINPKAKRINLTKTEPKEIDNV